MWSVLGVLMILDLLNYGVTAHRGPHSNANVPYSKGHGHHHDQHNNAHTTRHEGHKASGHGYSDDGDSHSVIQLLDQIPGRNDCSRLWSLVDSGNWFKKFHYTPVDVPNNKLPYLLYLLDQPNVRHQHTKTEKSIAMAKIWLNIAEKIVAGRNSIKDECAREPIRQLNHKVIRFVKEDLEKLEKEKSDEIRGKGRKRRNSYSKSKSKSNNKSASYSKRRGNSYSKSDSHSREKVSTKDISPKDEGYTLHYFDYRGRGEEIRLIFVYAGVHFKDKRYTQKEWQEEKKKVKAQLPFLDFSDGRRLFQSYAIERYLARRFGLAGKDAWEEAKVDEIADLHKDLENKLFGMGYTKSLSGNRFDDLSDSVEEILPKYEKYLKASDSGFFMNSGVTWVDFVVANFFETFKHAQPELWKHWHALEKFRVRVNSLPKIKEYVAKRKFTDM